MGSPKIGHGGIGVEMFGGRVAVVHPTALGPFDEVLRGGVLEGPDPVEEIPVERHVDAPLSIPEGHVVGVEGAVGEDRNLTHPAPADAVGRGQGHQAPMVPGLGESHRLVAGLGRSRRIVVPEGIQLGGAPDLQDVVVPGAVELHLPQ